MKKNNINNAFTTQEFWDSYEHVKTPNKGAISKWLPDTYKDYNVIREVKSYIESAQQQLEVAINVSVYKELEKQHTGDCTKDYENYNQRFEIERKKQVPNFDIRNYKDIIHKYNTTTLFFNFLLPNNCSLELELSIDEDNNYIYDQQLQLIKDKKNYPLALQTDHCSSPFVLKLEELNAIIQYLETHPNSWQSHSEIAWVLLVKFVAIKSKKEQEQLQIKYENILKFLGVKAKKKLPFSENSEWIKSSKGDEFICTSLPTYLENSVLKFTSESIKWMSGSYRQQNYNNNTEHIEFPFSLWEEVIKSITHNYISL